MAFPHERLQLIHVERLFDVVERPVTHRLHGTRYRGVGRHHHDLGTVLTALELHDELEPRHARHLQVRDDAIESRPFNNSKRLGRTRTAAYVVTHVTQHIRNRLARLPVVVNNKNSSARVNHSLAFLHRDHASISRGG